MGAGFHPQGQACAVNPPRLNAGEYPLDGLRRLSEKCIGRYAYSGGNKSKAVVVQLSAGLILIIVLVDRELRFPSQRMKETAEMAG